MADARAEVSEIEFIAEMAQHPDPVVTAGDLDDRLPISSQAINNRLKTFERNGWVASKKVGAAARVWWLTPEGKSRLDELRGFG